MVRGESVEASVIAEVQGMSQWDNCLRSRGSESMFRSW